MKIVSFLRDILIIKFLRNILFLAVSVAVLFPVIDRFFIYPLFVNSIIKNTEDTAVRVGEFLSLQLTMGPDGLTKDSISSEFVKGTGDITRSLGLMKLKIFSKSGETLFSTEQKDIGAINKHPYFLEHVVKGNVFTEVVRKEEKTLEGQVATKDVVETYVPLFKTGKADSEFAGAFEIYYDVTDRLTKMDRLLFVSSTTMAAAAVGLLIALLWTLGKASAAITERRRAEKSLKKNEERYRSLVEASPDGIFIQTDKGITFSNSAMVRMLGGDGANTVLSGDFKDFLKDEDRDRIGVAIDAAMRNNHQEVEFLEANLKNADGNFVNVELAAFSAASEGDLAAQVLVHDLTARREAERYQQMASIVFEASADAMMATDAKNHVEMVNPAFTTITGYTEEDMIGQDPISLLSGHQSEEFFSNMKKSLQSNDFWQGDIWSQRKNGEDYAQHNTISAIRDANGEISKFISVFSDITEKKLEEENARYEADHDLLTGLPNRTLLKKRLSQALNERRLPKHNLAVLFIDLDGFKPVNDTYGHMTGDLILQQVSKRLISCVREHDVVARLGGDEFVVVLYHIGSREDVRRIVEKIYRVFAPSFETDKATVNIGCSIGISLFPEDGNDATELI
ncbi:MAG: diguanylate cyclase, partial [Nitrospira sp.]|nr:diguanylate cyclase [Nitrospira sp.]